MLPGDPVTAVADAVAVLVDDIAKPILDENQSQAYDNELQQFSQQVSDAAALPDGPDRARAFAALSSRVRIDAGYVSGGVSEDESVPLQDFLDLLEIAKRFNVANKKLNDLLYALKTK
jgi:hypothetical protein